MSRGQPVLESNGYSSTNSPSPSNATTRSRIICPVAGTRNEPPSGPTGTLLQPLGQRLALGQLHHQKALAVVFLDTVQGGDVLVAERGEQFGLALKSRDPLGVPGHRLEQNLDRDLPIELGVLRTIDLAHAPDTEGAKIS